MKPLADDGPAPVAPPSFIPVVGGAALEMRSKSDDLPVKRESSSGTRPKGRPDEPIVAPATLTHLQAVLSQPDLEGTPYSIGERLGVGGMGAIYRAHDTRLDRDVALKVFHWPSPDDQAALGLLREARVLAQLDHPGIVPVYDVGTLSDGCVYYAMKLVRGHPLGDFARNLPLDRRLRLFERVCETVAFAHAKAVLHGDLKPSNIMVGAFGEVLVMDWGVARALAGRNGQGARTSASSPLAVDAHRALAGTPGYMPPEQVTGDLATLDARADVFALGAVLRFLVVGRHPTDLRQSEFAEPKRLKAIWERAMATTPAARYSSAEEVADDVARFLAREPVSAYSENFFERLGRLVAKHRVPLLLVLAYLAMRLALIWYYRR